MRHLAFVAVLAAGGCAQTDSSDLLTSGIYASITAAASGDGTTRVSTTLYVGNPINLNFVNLEGDDQLVASYGNAEMVMTETVFLNIVTHQATFNTDTPGDQFQVAFERSVDGGAPNSIAVLPERFTLDPLTSTTASRSQPLTLTWGPIDASNLMRWEARGDCIGLETQNLSVDAGTLTIEADRIKKREGEGVADQCPITITVTRGRPGQLDRGYGKGGFIEGQQVRTIMLTSTP
jgi:hypothetical protein